jgi:hypothetical protein
MFLVLSSAGRVGGHQRESAAIPAVVVLYFTEDT